MRRTPIVNSHKLTLVTIFAFLICQGCGYQFFVKKENVIKNVTGYFLMIDNGGFFVECKDSTYNIEKISKAIDGSELWFSKVHFQYINAYKSIGHFQPIKMYFDSTLTDYYQDTVYYAFVRYKSFPSDEPTQLGRNYIYFELNGEVVKSRLNYIKENVIYFRPELRNEEKVFNSNF